MVAAHRRVRVLAVLIALTAVTWVFTAVSSTFTASAVLATSLLVLDLLALVVSGRRRAVKQAVAERERRRQIERRRALARRRATVAADEAVLPVPEMAERTAPVVERPEPDAEPLAEPAAERVARELAEGGTPWVPVPVPPPTYTLKPAAPRPEPAPLELPPSPAPTDPAQAVGSVDEADLEQERAPRPWETDRTFADDLDLDAVLARRRAVNG